MFQVYYLYANGFWIEKYRKMFNILIYFLHCFIIAIKIKITAKQKIYFTVVETMLKIWIYEKRHCTATSNSKSLYRDIKQYIYKSGAFWKFKNVYNKLSKYVLRYKLSIDYLKCQLKYHRFIYSGSKMSSKCKLKISSYIGILWWSKLS